jgi:hypothetical protein
MTTEINSNLPRLLATPHRPPTTLQGYLPLPDFRGPLKVNSDLLRRPVFPCGNQQPFQAIRELPIVYTCIHFFDAFSFLFNVAESVLHYQGT